jgi:hypothetical protein
MIFANVEIADPVTFKIAIFFVTLYPAIKLELSCFSSHIASKVFQNQKTRKKNISNMKSNLAPKCSDRVVTLVQQVYPVVLDVVGCFPCQDHGT